jgi:hypothetical protein
MWKHGQDSEVRKHGREIEVWEHGWGSEAWKHGRDSEASEARHRAMLMGRYSIILGLERLYKPTTWSVER